MEGERREREGGERQLQRAHLAQILFTNKLNGRIEFAAKKTTSHCIHTRYIFIQEAHENCSYKFLFHVEY